MANLTTYRCVMSSANADPEWGGTFGCTAADLEQYVEDPADLAAIRALDIDQKYADSVHDVWTRLT